MEGVMNQIDGREDGRNCCEQVVGKELFHLAYQVM